MLLVLAGASRLAAGGLWAAAARAGCETRWSVYKVHSVTALARVQTRRSRPAHSLTYFGRLFTEDGSEKMFSVAPLLLCRGGFSSTEAEG